MNIASLFPQICSRSNMIVENNATLQYTKARLFCLYVFDMTILKYSLRCIFLWSI